MMIKHFDLAFTIDGDSIDLEQDAGCGEVDRINLHRLQLRMLAEQAGLLAAPSPTEAALRRRLLTLHERIEHLSDYLANNSDHEHADLSYEMLYARATASIAEEFIADVDEPVDPPTDDSKPKTSKQPALFT